ncbi:MAG: virulence factor [Vulcanimicrobiaceae bacterium]
MTYPNASWNNAYADIRRALEGYGFDRRQGSVSFGDESVTTVTRALATQDLTRSFPRFATCVRDIRILRIEENNDLRLAIDSAQT